MIFELAKEVNDIRLNWPVTKIVDRPSGQVSLFNHNGEELRCKRVIITGISCLDTLLLIIIQFR